MRENDDREGSLADSSKSRLSAGTTGRQVRIFEFEDCKCK